MGEQTIIHGRISVKRNFEKIQHFIATRKNDNQYPWIRSEMFSSGSLESPFYYSEPVIGFAASYKGLEHDLNSFILKFEYILENIDFDTAIIQMETEFFGTYDFFWKSKSENDRFNPEDQLVETERWYFGLGKRNLWGSLDIPFSENQIPPFDFEYPILFNEKNMEVSNQIVTIIRSIKTGEKVYRRLYIQNTKRKQFAFPNFEFL